MIINNDISITSGIHNKKTLKSDNLKKDFFASILENQSENYSGKGFLNESKTSTSMEDLIEKFREKGFKGLFKAIEEEKIKKLREEILSEMGFTEEELSELCPEQRAKIEKLVSEEIQRRMALGSMDDEKKKVQQNPESQNPKTQVNVFSGPDIFGNKVNSTHFLNLIPLINLSEKDSANKEDKL
jgi:hypothetical protein